MNGMVKVNAEDIKVLAEMADRVWHEYFTSLLSAEQIDYMVDKFQSESALKEQTENGGYEYYFLEIDGEKAGYTGLKPEPNEGRMFLSKLYILKEYRGKGYSHVMFDFIEDLCRKRKLNCVYLTVNKYNKSSIAVYNKKGFKNTGSLVTDIGNGFVMDDYVFELTV